MVASLALPTVITPRPAQVVNLWWIGGPPPDWLAALAPVVTAVSADALPVDADLIVSEVAALDASDHLRAVLRRCPRARALLIVVDLDAATEVDLLDRGAACVQAAGHPLTRARSSAFIGAGSGVRAPNPGDRRQRAFSVVTHLLATLDDELETYQQLVSMIAHELHSTRVSLLQVDRAAGVLVMRAAVGISPEIIAIARPRIGEGIAGTCALLGKPLYVDDHSRARSGSDLTGYLPDDTGGRQLPMSLTVPIKVRGDVVGVVNVTDRIDSEPYSQTDIDFISALMGQAGYLLENAQLLTRLRSERAFSERVIHTLTDPLVVVDEHLRVVASNQRFTRSFARDVPELCERVGASQAQRAALGTAVRDPDDGEHAFEGWPLGDGVFDVRVTPFADDGGGRRFLVFMHDVTERHQMERRLVSAEKMASLGVLAAGVAHEINNPIGFVGANARHTGTYFADLWSVIDGWHAAAAKVGNHAAFAAARSIEEDIDLGELREDATRMVAEMVEGVERVKHIVAGLKSYAHPDTQTSRESNPADLIANAMLLTAGQWKYSIDVECDCAGVAPISCLSTQLEQVFMNLIVNAAQAATAWGHLRITAEDVEGGLRLRFSDDCGGIPAHIVDKIFDPFFTTKDIGEGTGLGLSISYNIIETHGGTMRVESEAGVGTTFVVELPRGKAGDPMVVKQQSRFRI